MNAITQIQNTAPGPPRAIATGTPTMFEAPIDDARAVQAAANGDTPSSVSAFANILPNVCEQIYPK